MALGEPAPTVSRVQSQRHDEAAYDEYRVGGCHEGRVTVE